MKHLFLSFSVLVMFSCKSQEKKIENLTVKKDTMEYFDINKSKNLSFYHGYVYNFENKKPLKNVLVKENLKENFLTSKTDSNGYFKIQNNYQSIADLVFICKNFRNDTVKTVWSQHGEKLEYLFLNKIPDTIFLKSINIKCPLKTN